MIDRTTAPIDAMRKPSAPRRWPWIALGGLAGAAVAVASIQWAAHREWQAAVARAEAFRLRVDGLPKERPALYGEADAGSAWQAYSRAAAVRPNNGNVVWADLAADTSDAGAAALDAALDEWAPALAELARGARSRDASLAIDWSNGAHSHVFLEFAALADAAAASAQQLRRRGDPVAAARRLLELLQFARDLMGSPIAIHAPIGATILTDDLLPALFSGDALLEFSAPARAVLREGFVRALAEWPIDVTWGAQVILTLWDFERLPTWQLMRLSPIPTWRHAFSYRLAAADHAQLAMDFAEAMARRAPWAEVERLGSPPQTTSGRLLGPLVVSVAGQFREALADLHAMAAALAWCDGAAELPAAVAGPCGARLERRETAAEVVFASSGAAPAERVVRIPRSTLQRLGR